MTAMFGREIWHDMPGRWSQNSHLGSKPALMSFESCEGRVVLTHRKLVVLAKIKYKCQSLLKEGHETFFGKAIQARLTRFSAKMT